MLKVSDRVAVTFSGKTSKLLEFIAMAEEEGFEPPGPLRAQRFSRPPVSTAHALLRFQFYQHEQFSGPFVKVGDPVLIHRNAPVKARL